MKKKGKIVLLVIIILFLIVGVPLIINELYKVDKGYVTLWGAAEVLSYYGTILGASATLLAVLFTIKFTRRQISYNYIISQETLKWKKVEELIQNHFKLIMPTEIIKIYSPSDVAMNPAPYIENLNVREMEIKISLDWIKCYINPDDYKLISDFIDKLCSIDREINDVCDKIVKCLMQFEKNTIYIAASKNIEQGKGILSSQKISEYESMVKTNPYVEETTIFKKIRVYSDILLNIQEEEFTYLLNYKRDLFNRIYADLSKHELNKLGKFI